MDDLIERYLERVELKNAEATYDTYKTNLKQFDQWVDRNDHKVSDLDPLQIENYFLELKDDNYAPNTIASRFESLRGFYQFLSDKLGRIDENPIESLDRSDYVEKGTRKHDEIEISYVTKEEMEAMCDHVPSPKLRNELVIRLMWQTGIRKTELIELELDDLDRDDRSLKVWSNKSKETRTVYYQPSLDVLLDQWLDGGYRDTFSPAYESPYLFVTERSEQLHSTTVTDKIVKPAAENAGIQEVIYTDKSGSKRHRITPHSLRHGHAVQALKSGIDIRTVQQHLGHANLDMTMRYLQLIEDDVKEGYEQFSSQI